MCCHVRYTEKNLVHFLSCCSDHCEHVSNLKPKKRVNRTVFWSYLSTNKWWNTEKKPQCSLSVLWENDRFLTEWLLLCRTFRDIQSHLTCLSKKNRRKEDLLFFVLRKTFLWGSVQNIRNGNQSALNRLMWCSEGVDVCVRRVLKQCYRDSSSLFEPNNYILLIFLLLESFHKKFPCERISLVAHWQLQFNFLCSFLVSFLVGDVQNYWSIELTFKFSLIFVITSLRERWTWISLIRWHEELNQKWIKYGNLRQSINQMCFKWLHTEGTWFLEADFSHEQQWNLIQKIEVRYFDLNFFLSSHFHFLFVFVLCSNFDWLPSGFR